MPTRQRKMGLRMIEGANARPIVFAMALLACLTQPALVFVLCFVAPNTLAWSVSKLGFRRVTAFASRVFVAANEREVRRYVIECFFIELHDVGGPSLMVRMADVAVGLGGAGLLAMQAPAEVPVARGILVAGKAKTGLRGFSECLVAISAILFKLRMSLHKLARRHKLFENILGVR
jgi:hypothetical protein